MKHLIDIKDFDVHMHKIASQLLHEYKKLNLVVYVIILIYGQDFLSNKNRAFAQSISPEINTPNHIRHMITIHITTGVGLRKLSYWEE